MRSAYEYATDRRSRKQKPDQKGGRQYPENDKTRFRKNFCNICKKQGHLTKEHRRTSREDNRIAIKNA